MKIAICASEVVPFAKTGGLADACGALPVALERLGHEVIVVMPGYKAVLGMKQPQVKKLGDGLSGSVIGKNAQVYFIENDAYFNRDNLYGDKAGDYPDNLDRFSYFSRRALSLLKEQGFRPDIIHCHDWQASLVPVYKETLFAMDDFYRDTATVLTIHPIGSQGVFPKEQFPKLGLDWGVFTVDGLEYYDKVNVLKGGIVFSDAVNTVSATYAREIQTREFGFGLEGVLEKRKDSLSGIINGLDYSIWDPQTDPFIAKNYSENTFKAKARNKQELQKACRLPVTADVPLFGMVSRLAQQKGFDILGEAIDEICRLGLQLVILGTGDGKYQEILRAAQMKYPKVISLNVSFDDPLAHTIYAGADAFLMPSKYEPCGLGQMIALKYGTVPLVFKTGGLADTVTPRTGFLFKDYSARELVKTIKKAAGCFENEKIWSDIARRGMKCDFSWQESAKKYVTLYEKARAR